MSQYEERLLSQYEITPAQWAILFSASYYLPVPVEHYVNQVYLESEENFSIDELANALDDCLMEGWICGADEERMGELAADYQEYSFEHLENGVVLTEAGTVMKELVSQALLETAGAV